MENLNAIEPQSTPIKSRKDVARSSIRVIRGVMKHMGRLHREFVTPIPRSIPGGHVTMLVSPLPDRRRELVGESRVWVYVPEDVNLPIQVRVEWTRNAFGFWYRNSFRLDNIDDPTEELMKRFDEAMRWVRTTADGSVRLVSMNRMFKKVKKNKVRDEAARNGMVIG